MKYLDERNELNKEEFSIYLKAITLGLTRPKVIEICGGNYPLESVNSVNLLPVAKYLQCPVKVVKKIFSFLPSSEVEAKKIWRVYVALQRL